MNRRSFTRQALVAATAVGTLSFAPKRKKRLRPARLHKGDSIGLITPASYIEDDGLEKAVTHLESLGLKVIMGRHVRSLYGNMAGTDAERLADLHDMFANPGIKGIWCARGGYGSARLLDQLDYRLIRHNPKVLVGYSDITALHCAILQQSGLITFHGPVGSSELTDYTRSEVESILFTPSTEHIISIAAAQLEEAKTDDAYSPRTITPGRAEGELLGGNLSLLAALAGTPYLPDLKGKLLFVEDIGEKPYRIDRMLTSLRQNKGFRQAVGIVLGVFAGCEASENSRSLSLQETLKDRLGDLGIPVLYGLSFGHVDDMTVLPMGIKARLDTEQQTLTLLESAVL